MNRYRGVLIYVVVKIGLLLLIRELLKYELKRRLAESQRIQGV